MAARTRKKTTKKKTTKKATKKKTTKRATKKKIAENLIVGSKVKAFIRSNDCLTSGDFLAALNEHVYELVQNATERAQGNKRSTVRTWDL